MKRLFILIFLFLVPYLSQAQEFESLVRKGDSCIVARNYTDAILLFHKALKERPEALLNTKEEVQVLFLLGYANSSAAKYQKSIEWFIKFINKDVIKTNKPVLSSTYNGIGNCYTSLEEFDLAIKYYKKCAETAGEDLYNLSSSLQNIAIIQLQQNNIDSARVNFKKSDTYIKQMDSYIANIVININLAELELKDNKLDASYQYLLIAKKISEENTDTFYLAVTQITLAKYYMITKDYKKAEELLILALENAKKVNDRQQVVNSYRFLVELYQKQENYKKALETVLLFKSSNDSITALDSDSKYAELEARYSIKEKEQENSLLKKEKQLTDSKITAQTKYIWMLSLIIIFTLSLVILIYIQRVRRAKTRLILIAKNKEILKSQKQLKDLNFQYEKLIKKYEANPNDLADSPPAKEIIL